jgi:hypothetical protein
VAKSPVTCVHSCPFSARGSIVAGLYTVSDDRGAPLGRGCLSVLGDFRCQFTRFLKEFSPSPQPLTAPDFRLQPPRLLFLEDEYPKTSRPTDTSTLQDRQPTLRPSQGLLQCQLPQHQPSARSQVLPGEPSQKPKANFAQPQSAQQKIGFVPSFCPPPELVPSPLDALSRRCRNPSGGRAEGASKTSKSSPSPLFRSRPELPEPRTASHPPVASPKRLRTQPRPPTCPVVL